MRKSPRWLLFLLLAIAALLIIASCVILPLAASMHMPSLGIIGGADGPTAIFVTGHSPLGWIIAAAAVLLVVGVIGLIKTGSKR